jgi:hypothetical protein
MVGGCVSGVDQDGIDLGINGSMEMAVTLKPR